MQYLYLSKKSSSFICILLGCSKKVTTIIFALQGIIISIIAFIASAFALIQFNEWHQLKIRAIFKSPIAFYEFGPLQFGIMILALIVIMALSISIIANKAKRLKLIDIVEIN